MLGRRGKHPVLAEVPAPQGGSARPGALGRGRLEAFSNLAVGLARARVVLSTGPARLDVALGLATAAAAEGRRVALLECDLAEPQLAERLGLAPHPGLHEYLRGDAEVARILQSLVLSGPASGRAVEPLTCIVAGEPLAEPIGLLDSDRCDHAIEKLRHAYDLLVIDGPALARKPEALRALAELADATVACGPPRELPRRLPVPVTGLVTLG